MVSDQLVLYVLSIAGLYIFLCRSDAQTVQILGWLGIIASSLVAGTIADNSGGMLFSLFLILVGMLRLYTIIWDKDVVTDGNIF